MATSVYRTGKHLIEIPCNTCDATYSLSEVAQRVVKKIGGIQFHQLPFDKHSQKLAHQWQVTQVPALILINEGEVVGKVHGYQPDEILEIYIKAKLKEENI